MAETRQFVKINSDLLESSKESFQIIFDDGENEIALSEANLPPETDYRNPYDFDLTRFLPNTEIFDLDRFFELARLLINDALTRSGQPAVALVEEYPPLDWAAIGTEVISYRIISREPASMSADGNSRQQRTNRISYNMKDTSVGDNIIEVSSRPLDHEIEFICWAKSNKLANKRAMWLEKLFVNHAWVFRSQGADRFYFKKRLSDGYLTTGNQRILYRPLRFFLRYNEFITKANYEIKDMKINLKLTPRT